MRRRGYLLVIPLLVVLTALTLSIGVSAQSLSGFESGNPFQGEDHVISLISTTEWSSQGSRSLRINHGSIPAGDANRLWIRVMGSTDWTGATSVQADFFVPEDATQNYSAALMVQVGDGYTWYESEPIPLAPGENLDLSFDLTNDQWRSAATSWRPGATPPLSGMRAWGFLVFSDSREPGYVYLDNVRLNRPAADAGGADTKTLAGALSQLDQRIRISGKAELTVKSEPKTVDADAPKVPVGMAPGQWEISPGSGNHPALVATTDMDGKSVQAIGASAVVPGTEVGVNLGGADLSGYKYISMDVKVSWGTGGQKGLQWTLRRVSGYNDTQHFPRVNDGEWHRFVLSVDDFTAGATFADINFLGVRTFDGDPSDFLIANVYFIGETDDKITTTELTRTHQVTVNLDYELQPDWMLRVTGIMADPVVRLGLVQIEGNSGSFGVRAFHNGTAASSADPLTFFKGSKFHENKTTGLDVSTLVGNATLRGMLLRPSDPALAGKQLGAVTLDLPGAAGNTYLFAVRESEEGAAEGKSGFGAAARTNIGNVEVKGELISSGAEEEGTAWMVETSTPIGERVSVTLHAREYGSNVVPAYNDHANHNGYGQRSIDAKWAASDSLDVGLYFQNWFRTNGSWNELYHKLTSTWRGTGFTLTAYNELKRVLKSGEYTFDSGRTSAKVTTRLADVFDVTGLIWLTMTADGTSLPTHLVRVGFEPVSDLVVSLEAASVTPGVGDEPTQNVYTKVTRKFTNGELSIALGKPTLNSDEDKHENTSTATGYVEVKLAVEF